MEICKKCGSELSDSGFCTKCGAGVADEESNAVSDREKKKGKSFIKSIVVVAIIVACYIVFFGGRGYRTTVQQYVNAIKNGNASKIVSLLPTKYADHIIRNNFKGDRQDFIDSRQMLLDELQEQFSAKNIDITKVKYSIDDKYSFDKDDLKAVKQKRKMGSAKKAMKVDIELSANVNGKEKYASFGLILVKFGRSWYVYDTGAADGIAGLDAFQALCYGTEIPTGIRVE